MNFKYRKMREINCSKNMDITIGNFPPVRNFYYIAMQQCTHSALHSLESMKHLYSEYSERLHERDIMFSMLNEMQNVIHQGGNLSRYLWPSRNNHKSRGEFLRNFFDIEDDNSLNNRDLRNALEHYDERLDNFIKDKEAGNFVPEYFGPKLSNQEGVRHFMRSYFVDTDEFTVLGEVFTVKPLKISIDELNLKITDAIQ